MPIGPLTTMMIESEIATQRRLYDMLTSGAIETRAAFKDLMVASFQYGKLNLQALSDDLGYTYVSVHRWAYDQAAPHPCLWPRITEWIKAALIAKAAASELMINTSAA